MTISPTGPDSGNETEEFPPPVVQAAELALERKAEGVVALDLRGISSATDFFILATGKSDVQVKAISEHIMEELARAGVRPLHVEGMDRARWVLMDFVDFVIHVLHPSARDFYQLETLWGDAPTRVFGS